MAPVLPGHGDADLRSGPRLGFVTPCSVLRGYWNPATPFTARCYVREDVTVQPTYPQTAGGFARTPRSSQLWLGYDLPWTARDSADGALAQALGFLEERATKK